MVSLETSDKPLTAAYEHCFSHTPIVHGVRTIVGGHFETD
jgi:hypothetical protein